MFFYNWIPARAQQFVHSSLSSNLLEADWEKQTQVTQMVPQRFLRSTQPFGGTVILVWDCTCNFCLFRKILHQARKQKVLQGEEDFLSETVLLGFLASSLVILCSLTSIGNLKHLSLISGVLNTMNTLYFFCLTCLREGKIYVDP